MIGTRYRVTILFPLIFTRVVSFAVDAVEELFVISHILSFLSFF